MHYSVIFYVLVIDFLALMSPGPDFFMVLRNSLTKSFEAGVYTAMGICLGTCVTFAIGMFGIGGLIAHSKILFIIFKISGASYLAYLGIKSILDKETIQEPNIIALEINHSLSEYFRIGLWCNLTNPKAFMFIIALSTYVVQHGSPFIDGSIIVLISTISTFIWFSLVSFIFGTYRARQIFYSKQRIIHILFGLILLYIAFRIISF